MAEHQFGPYRLIRQIAVGGMAEIHLAKTTGIAGFEKYVALKMIHPNFAEDEQFIQMLVDEAKIAVQLTHGNIAQTFDLGRVGETYYITMEYVDGADLYKLLRRASEQDVEMPLDVCAFVGKEVASALDHAHRKRDHTGKPLGIVHRDVSPQNVLISYAGEVKLVDFGIAKATMKARQTAVGVIKGKYYYMSPEQAWGDPIDYRSDIFSAGIVLYEMITGQMLYLEEDLHKLLDMARKAEIAPPGKLRKGVPPQLEKIVMRALQKAPGDRYQSAGDFASDLERFLHTYSPVFTAGKVSTLIKKVIGDPMQIPVPAESAAQDYPSVEVRGGVMGTMTIDDSELAHAADREHLRDENSVIFRVSELKPGGEKAPRAGTQPLLAPPETKPAAAPARAKAPTGKIPSIRSAAAAAPAAAAPAAAAAARPAAKPAPPVAPVVPAKRPAAKPRAMNEETRQLTDLPPAPPDDGSGLLSLDGKRVAVESWDGTATQLGGGVARPSDDDLENVGEHTMITGAPMGFMMDVATEDGVDATMVGSAPEGMPSTEDTRDEDDSRDDAIDDEEGPTLTRETFEAPPARRPSVPKGRVQPPPALAANIHSPAVSELRKPRSSRRTPPGGVPTSGPNLLQQIVASQPSAPMPAPPPPRPPQAAAPPAPPPPPQFPSATPGGQPAAMGYAADASGLPLAPPTDPNLAAQYGHAPHLQPYQHAPGIPNPYGQPYGQPYGMSAPPMPAQSPGALYQMGSRPMPPTLTGQMRLFEVDELPAQYKLGESRRRWFTYIVSAVIAISVAAGATFLIIRMTREGPPELELGHIRVDTVPSGAEVYLDGLRQAGTTPMDITEVQLGTRHEIKIQLARHKEHVEMVDVPKATGEGRVTAVLKPITGKILINSKPAGAEIRINDQLRGTTPRTLTDIDMASAKRIELRLKDYQVHVQDLEWPANGQIDLDITLTR